MLFFSTLKGEDVEIPSLVKDGNFLQVSNMDDMLTLVQAMGWKDFESFSNDTQKDPMDLLDKSFCVLLGAGVFFKDDPNAQTIQSIKSN